MKKLNKNIVIIGIVIIISGFFFSGSCLSYMRKEDKDFKDTPAWEISKAIYKQDVNRIKEILKENSELLDCREPRFGMTLLFWAVGMDKYNSVETLLKCGADPNQATIKGNSTPVDLASGYLWNDYTASKDPKYVKLLLKYGADPNIAREANKEAGIEAGTTPLMNSIGCGIEKTKALVEAGADINAKMIPSGRTAAWIALSNHNPTTDYVRYAHYLIAVKKAKVNEVYYRIAPSDDPKDRLYLVNKLRNWVFEPGTEKYQMKMEIIEEFARQGVNYWETSIPQDALEHIKYLHPNDWEEYIKRY